MSTSTEELLEAWYRRLRESQFSHYEAAKAFERMNYWLGIPSVMLSTVLGTSIFATIGESVNTNVQILFGLVSVVAAVLTGLQTFLRFSERSEKHRAIAARYGSLRREIEELSAVGENFTREMITPLRESIDRLAEEAPNVPERIWMKTQKALGDNNASFPSRSKPSKRG
ncbi:SLATT domain-containing protein [Leptolyngbya sp. FACHB-711]|uniref:SLATT domain-containing protein n=1 Tax=Leptolyngbya sp. FACHB-711 TaxID=2692813 RepID=UPI00168721EF|nr:SLATT domain-containing protein [Leptolyngbya sp. FACHB-711]MBD2023793.1 SLATT domain-containing protein [Leptolyngbya sp. FACHB-711]